jgi:ABC-2 type transport system ATP-binding protein
MGHGEPVVEAHGLTKWYGDITALDGVDLRVEPGTIHGLLGPNGAGKTTLLSVLFGLVLPDEGTVRLFGRTRSEAGADWLDGVGGFVESPRFYPYLSGRRNLQILAGLDGGGAQRLVDEVLDLVGLAGATGQKVRGYSLGMRQRLGLAAALLRRPRLLILDEPTNGMDPAGIRDLRSALLRLAHEGLSVILSSHDVPQVEELCESATVLFQGRVAFAAHLDGLGTDAPDPSWRVNTSDNPTALALAAGRAGLRVSGGYEDRALVVSATEAVLDQYVAYLVGTGIAIRGLALAATPLETLFFQLTEADRDEAAQGGRDQIR